MSIGTMMLYTVSVSAVLVLSTQIMEKRTEATLLKSKATIALKEDTRTSLEQISSATEKYYQIYGAPPTLQNLKDSGMLPQNWGEGTYNQHITIVNGQVVIDEPSMNINATEAKAVEASRILQETIKQKREAMAIARAIKTKSAIESFSNRKVDDVASVAMQEKALRLDNIMATSGIAEQINNTVLAGNTALATNSILDAYKSDSLVTTTLLSANEENTGYLADLANSIPSEEQDETVEIPE